MVEQGLTDALETCRDRWASGKVANPLRFSSAESKQGAFALCVMMDNGWVRAMDAISTAAFNTDTAPQTMIRAGGSSEMRFGSQVWFTNPQG